MRVILCDDEKAQAALLKDCVEAYARTREIAVKTTVYYDCDTLWWDLQDGADADLILLDIQMVKTPMSGIELARRMRAAKMSCPVCFVTAIRDYVFEGYEVDAIGYLLKPYEKEQVFRILDKAATLMRQEKRYVFLPAEKERVKIDADEIIAIEASAHDTIVHLRDAQGTGAQSLNVKKGFQTVLRELCAELSGADDTAPPFLTQIHRSYAVNMRHILRVTKDACVGEGSVSFPVARGMKEEAMQAFIAANKAEGMSG